MPPMMSSGFGSVLRPGPELGWTSASRTRPTARSRPPRAAKRCVGWGRGGRPDRAATIGTRAADRAGHQAAATAVRTARARAVPMAHHGRSNRSIRWSASVSRWGAKAIQPTRPAAAPVMAAAAPTTAPLATSTSRTWRSAAPTAPSMPRARWRRWAMTVKPATATRPTNSRLIVARASTAAAAAFRAASWPSMLKDRPLGRWSDWRSWGWAASRTVTMAGGSACPGATSPNSSDSRRGFSTSPTTRRARPPSFQVSPRRRSYEAATPWVTATSPAPVG